MIIIYLTHLGNNQWKIYTEKVTLYTFHNSNKIAAIEFAESYITSWQGAVLQIVEEE